MTKLNENPSPVTEKGKSFAVFQWSRFSLRDKLIRTFSYLVVAVLVYWSLKSIDIVWEWVWDAPYQIRDLFGRMFPPNLNALPSVIKALVESIHIATLGTLLAVLLALPIAYLGAQNVTPNKATLWFARLVIVATRSVDTLVWALFFVAVFGPGPFAGILAIAFRSIGFLAKLIGEAVEEIDWKPIEALQASGASRWHILVYGIVPQVVPNFLAVTILRWDVNIRESTVLGLVGAGGIGFVLQVSIDSFRWRTVGTIIIAIVAIVLIGELVTGYLRRKII